MTEQSILLTIGSLPVTAYGICIAIAAAAGLLWIAAQCSSDEAPG